jgi:hypothetical protein
MQTQPTDLLGRFRHIDIVTSDLTRWEDAGRRLETVAPQLLSEVLAIGLEPNKIRLSLAANAARYASWVADEPLKTEAVALAEELEQRSV